MSYHSILISGLPGAGKSCLARGLSEKLGWPIYSIGGLFKEEWKRLYPNKEVSFEEYWRTITKEKNMEMNKRAREIIARGNAIGDFRFAVCCDGLPSLRIYVTADLETRAKRVKDKDGKSTDQLKRILMARELDEVKVGKELYGGSYDFRETHQYHIILNSGLLRFDQELNAVIDIFKI